MKPDFKKWNSNNEGTDLYIKHIGRSAYDIVNQFAEEYAKQEAIEFGMFMKFDSEKYKDEYRLAYQKNQTDLGFTEYCYQKYKDEKDNNN